MNKTPSSRGKAALWRFALGAGLAIEIAFIVIAVVSLVRGNADIPAWQQLAFVAILVWIYIAYLKQRAMDISSFVVDEKIKAHSLVENLEEGIILVDPTHRILLLNNRAALLTGLSEIESLERSLLEEVDEATRAMLQSNRAGENACTFARKGKTVRLGIKLLATHAAEEPHKLIRVYEAEAAAAPAATAGTAPEIRAALDVLREVAGAGTTPPRLALQAQSVLTVMEQAPLLAAIRARTLASTLSKRRTPLGPLMESVIQPLQPVLQKLQMKVDAPQPPSDANLDVDPALGAMALNRMLLYAALAGRQADTLTIKTSPMGGNMGILFRLPEQRLDADATARLFEDPGLLLARGIVEAHGGSMWAESPAGGGLNITLMLPLSFG